MITSPANVSTFDESMTLRVPAARKLQPYLRSCNPLAQIMLDERHIDVTDERLNEDAIAHYKIPRGVIKLNDGRVNSPGCAFSGLHLFLVLHNGGPSRPIVEGRCDRILGATHAVRRAWSEEMRNPRCASNRLEFGCSNEGDPDTFWLSDLVLTSVGRWGQADGLDGEFNPEGRFVRVESLQFCAISNLQYEKRVLHDGNIVSMSFQLGENYGRQEEEHRDAVEDQQTP